jgi:hypothetical protein
LAEARDVFLSPSSFLILYLYSVQFASLPFDSCSLYCLYVAFFDV